MELKTQITQKDLYDGGRKKTIDTLNIFNNSKSIYTPSQNNFSSIKVHSKLWYIPIALACISLIGLLIYIPIKRAYKITTLVIENKKDDNKTANRVSYLVSGFNVNENGSFKVSNKNKETFYDCIPNSGFLSNTIKPCLHQKIDKKTKIIDPKNINDIYKGYVASKWVLGIAAVVAAVGLLAIFGCNIPGSQLGFLKEFYNIAHAQLGSASLIGITTGIGFIGFVAVLNIIRDKVFKKPELEIGKFNKKFNYILEKDLDTHNYIISSYDNTEILLQKARALKKIVKNYSHSNFYSKLKAIITHLDTINQLIKDEENLNSEIQEFNKEFNDILKKSDSKIKTYLNNLDELKKNLLKTEVQSLLDKDIHSYTTFKKETAILNKLKTHPFLWDIKATS